MLLPWQHAFAGPSYTPSVAFWSRWHLREYYTPTSDSIPGNDDYGTLSAWGVFTYLGLYPVAGTSLFILGSPIFASAVITAPSMYARYGVPVGEAAVFTLRITCTNASAGNIYVSAVRVNGQQALKQPFVTWDVLWPSESGGDALIEFDMVPTPTLW